MAELAWVAIVVGVIGTLGAWLTGEGSRAAATRRALGPWLARTGLAWAIFAALLLLVVWALPLHRFLTTAILVVLSCVGFEISRRQVVAEQAAAGPPPPLELPTLPWRKPKPQASTAAAPTTQVEELERLARLRSDDLLTEEEYATAKGRLLSPAGRT